MTAVTKTALSVYAIVMLTRCEPWPEPEVPYPDLDEVPLVVQEYLVDQLGPCDEIWTIDLTCDDYGFCRVHLICDAGPEQTLASVNLALYCPDLHAGPDDPLREPCVLAPLLGVD